MDCAETKAVKLHDRRREQGRYVKSVDISLQEADQLCDIQMHMYSSESRKASTVIRYVRVVCVVRELL